MRALCGAIITAGALIGLGLTAMGIGERYRTTTVADIKEGDIVPLHLHHLDRPLAFILVFLTCVAVVGLGIAFLGLAYHHHRRHHEHLREQARLGTTQRTAV
jgi:hypothetical protein